MNQITHATATLLRRAFVITFFLLLAASQAKSQSQSSVTDGVTPQAIKPGAPILNACNPSANYPNSRGRIFASRDGNGATFVSDDDIYDYPYPDMYDQGQDRIYPNGYFILRDGTRYRIELGAIKWMRDRNGNKLTFENNKITDSITRETTLSFNPSSFDQVTYLGYGGTSRQVKVWYSPLSAALRLGFSIQTYKQLFPELPAASGLNYVPTVISAIDLPDGRRYEFRYNSYGEIARIVLPTGGAIEYDYAAGIRDAYASGQIGEDAQGYSYGSVPPPPPVFSPVIYRRVIERRVYSDGVTLQGKTTYSRPEQKVTSGWQISNQGYVDEDNLAPDGTLLSRTRHHYQGYLGSASGPASKMFYSQGVLEGYPDEGEGKEYKTEQFGSGGISPLIKTENIWTGPVITETKTTLLDTNQVSKQTFAYDSYYNRKDIYEYDYNTGAPPSYATRHTHTDYLTTNPVNGANYATDTNIYIRSLPSQQQLYDAGGVERARTTYEYDNYTNDANHASLVDRPGIFGLDSGFTTAYTKRGNVTRVSRFILANTGLVGSDTEFAAYSQYDIAGNVVKTKDPKGNVAQVSYSGTYQYALPTTQTSPIPDTSGYYASSASFTTTVAYDFWTGRVTSTTDANSQVTTAEYNDVLDRLTRIVRPAGGGETTYQYGDTVGSLYLHTQTKQDVSTWLDDYVLYDGLGRAWRSSHYEGPSSWSATETKYDAIGRAAQVSNPYTIASFNATTPTSGVLWTTTAYDALSRVVTMTTPDGAFVSTAYSGNTVTVEDQHDPNDPDTTKRVGRKRASVADALGRLIQVTEDPGGLSHQTYYTYDVLGNLVRVNQGSQNRYFLYDSLSRLVRARNVEQDANSSLATSAVGTYPGLGNTQWTTGYTYDADSNLYQRTDARNVLTTYGYDALNRNIWASYNDGATPVIERHYDAATNGKGRLSYHLSYNSHPVTSAPAYSFMVINAYDAMGRPLSGSQQLLNSGGTWTAYAMSQSYDLAGHLLSQTYPSGRSVNYSYNAGSRTSSFSGGLGDGVTRTYADSFSYNPAGQMTKERFGATTALYHNIHYNSRLQPVDIRLGTNSADEWGWNRGALITYNSIQARNAGNAFQDAKDNNGNVTMQEHYVPTDDAISSYAIPLRDTYEYDKLNRLTQTNGVQRNTAGSWFSVYAQWYNYDQYGNRVIDNPHTWGAGINNNVYTINTANNQINGLTYDAAGNVTSDPNGVSTATYDGENRMRNALKGGQWNYYVYDADGRRVRRILGAQETWQIYGFGGELIAEYPANGAASTPQKEYGYRDGQMLIVGGCDVVRWVMSDHLGTPRIEADATGSLANIRRHDYLPFGEELLVGMGNGSIRTTGMGYTADCVRQRFGAKERDGETGLDFFLARYYSSTQGRFTSPDEFNGGPVEVFAASSASANPTFYADLTNPQSLNKYQFTYNNPLKYTDPDGHVPDIAVIENGPTEGNPIGHTAIAVTGYGVFSFGNNTELGSSLIDYVNREVSRRDTNIYIIKTTPEQDKAVVEALLKQDAKGGLERYPDNCTSRSNCGLDAAGIPKGTTQNGGKFMPGPTDTSIPGSAGDRTKKLPNGQVKVVPIPKGSTTVPVNDLKQFEPTKPHPDLRLPKKENKKPQDNDSSSS